MIHPFNRCFEKVLVLTTDHEISEERRTRISSRLEEVEYSFFYGANYAKLNIDDYYNDGNRYLTPGQIACALSFNMICEYIVDNNIENCLVMEDDIIINDNINLLDKIYDQLPSNWQLFYLGYGHCDSTPHPNYSKNLFKIDRYTGYHPSGTFGFAISKSFAKVLYETNSKLRWTSDGNLQNILRNTDNVGYASVPKIIDHDGIDSVVSEGS